MVLPLWRIKGAIGCGPGYLTNASESLVRVLTIVRNLALGGTQRVAQNYVAGYRMTGHETAVLTMEGGGPRADPLAASGVPVFLGGRQGELDTAIGLAISWSPEIIHIHRVGLRDPATGSVLRHLRGALGYHHAVIETNVFGKVDSSSDRLLIDLHLHLTKWSFWKWTRRITGMRPRPIGVVMPNLVDTSMFRVASEAERNRYRDAVGVPRDAFVFGRVGQPIEAKWSPMVIDAFNEVAKAHPQTYLLLLGMPSDLRDRISRLSAPVQMRVVEAPLTLSDHELRACYGAMDVFLHASSIGESFGMVLVEAMLGERPAITLSTPTKDNGQLEVVGHNSGGLVVTDRESMIEAMERLIGDTSLRERLARDGAESARSRYGLQENMDALGKIAGLALRSKTPTQLRQALDADATLTTSVTDSEIRALLWQSLGRPSFKDRMLMNFVDLGWVYRPYSRYLFPLLKG
jgi:glycosyltransferase involved in cell wall biosynthesis